MKRRLVGLTILFAAILVGLTSGPTIAFPLVMDYTGFTWSILSGGQWQFEAVGVLDNFSPWVGVPGETYTFHLSGLALSSEQNLGSGFYRRSYAGGDLKIYQSTSALDRPYDYGVFPPNPTAPSSFTDGIYWLGGDLSSFSLLVDTGRGLATASGQGAYADGSYYENIADDGFFTFAGLTKDPSAGVPLGYEYRMDGQVSAAVTPIPEPATLVLLGTGLLGMGASLRRPKR